MKYLHLGILAYWLVNTIRHQLKAKQVNSNLSEIVRFANTQKVITTTGQHTFDKRYPSANAPYQTNNYK